MQYYDTRTKQRIRRVQSGIGVRILIESGVYAAGTASALIKGKTYNRGVRAHKLLMEAFFRLMWNAFLIWLDSNRGDAVRIDKDR